MKTFVNIRTDTRGQLPTAWDSDVCSNDCWNEIKQRKHYVEEQGETF